MPQHSTRFLITLAVIVVACASVFVAFARTIPCAWCHEPWGVHERLAGDLCRSCAKVFDRRRLQIGYRRSLLRRLQIWRAA